MIFNTDKLNVRKLMDQHYIAIHGTQENSLSDDYDILDKDEAKRMVAVLRVASEELNDLADKLDIMVQSLS